MFITVIGMIDGKLQERTFPEENLRRQGSNAIQRTTASGVCAVVQAYSEGKLQGLRIPRNRKKCLLMYPTSNKFGKLYEQE